MARHQRLIEKMVEIGIPAKEARIYSALLQKRELSALEIQAIAHVPRTKVYEITHRMIMNNMCIEKRIRGRKKFQAAEPEQFFRNLMKKRERELARQREIAKEIEEIASLKYRRNLETTDFAKSIEEIADQSSIYERYVSLLKNTRKELIGFVKPPYFHRYQESKLNEQDDIMFQKVKKGMKVSILYEIPKQKIAWTSNYIQRCVEKGEKARLISDIPAKIYIFDGERMALILPNGKHSKTQFTMFVINHTALAQAGKSFFNYLWKQALDYRVLASRIKKV